MDSKRLFDITLATLAIVLFSPLLLFIALRIRLEDGRPLLFRQQRIGKGQTPFVVYKFRSMRDGKVTRTGAWIRQTCLDELLQFINVLNGTMSLVGPRPLTAADIQRLRLAERHRERFCVRPGITGLPQLFAGKGLRISRWLDRHYGASASLALDLRIILLSVAINLLGKRRVRGWLNDWRARGRRRRRLQRSP